MIKSKIFSKEIFSKLSCKTKQNVWRIRIEIAFKLEEEFVNKAEFLETYSKIASRFETKTEQRSERLGEKKRIWTKYLKEIIGKLKWNWSNIKW